MQTLLQRCCARIMASKQVVDNVPTLKQQSLIVKENALSSTAGFSPGLTERGVFPETEAS